ncbi:hypothetical protein ACIBG0_15110 [Nocardia sp. NPDC050630]|uniref:hypothetical protein n=1 Tax=Nocardia sp. NPDC050630 TaxID=3364321 RepID=UPI0037A5AC24
MRAITIRVRYDRPNLQKRIIMNKLSSWPTAVCWLIVLLEGYDLVVLGAVIPTLIEHHHIGFTAAGTTFVATIALVAVAIGAAGEPLADRYERRRVLASIALSVEPATLHTSKRLAL